MLDLDCLLLFDLQSTAYWRCLKAQEYPDDERNAKAAEILGRLAPQVEALNGSPLHLRISTFLTDELFSSVVSDILRSVGFRFFPSTGEELLREIVARLEISCTRDYLTVV